MPSGSKTKELLLNSIRQEEARPTLGMVSQAGNLCRRDVYKVCRGSQAGLFLLVFTQYLYLLLPAPRAVDTPPDSSIFGPPLIQDIVSESTARQLIPILTMFTSTLGEPRNHWKGTLINNKGEVL